MIGHLRSMVMPVDQSARQAGPGCGRLRRMRVMRELVRRQAEQDREGQGGEQETGGERAADRHSRILTEWEHGVKPARRQAGGTAVRALSSRRRSRARTGCAAGERTPPAGQADWRVAGPGRRWTTSRMASLRNGFLT